MELSEQLVESLREALGHLYDPSFRPSEDLWILVRGDSELGVEWLQRQLIEAIQELKPGSDVPRTARIWRIYGLLHDRYVSKLTQEEAAARLGITPRHLRRQQREAIEALAQRLCCRGDRAPVGRERLSAPEPQAGQPIDWQAQVKSELASLRESAGSAVADVRETVEGVVTLESALFSRQGLSLSCGDLGLDLEVSIHPTALRQVLIVLLGALADRMASGQVELAAVREGDTVEILIQGAPIESREALDSDLAREILSANGGTLGSTVGDESMQIRVGLPLADKATVLVVDDNVDLVHFFRRYTTGTRYRIAHTPRGREVYEMIGREAPDIIVLDVMLPDVDGWELLMHLYEDLGTRSIPVIVCSVVHEEELALSLGAALYLTKPVRRREFICALDQASGISPAPT